MTLTFANKYFRTNGTSLPTKRRELVLVSNGWCCYRSPVSSHVISPEGATITSTSPSTTATTTAIEALSFSWLQELVDAQRLQEKKNSVTGNYKIMYCCQNVLKFPDLPNQPKRNTILESVNLQKKKHAADQ